MAVEHALTLKSKESVKWTAKVTPINKYVSANVAEPGNVSGRMP